MNLMPDPDHLSQAMSSAMAPAFLLGAVAAYISVLLGRAAIILDRLRSLNEIADGPARARLKAEIPLLLQRAKLIKSAAHLAFASGMCTSLLLIVVFVSALYSFRHQYGAAILFGAAIGLLGTALYKFGQEVRMSFSELDFYR